ncbi:MAG TPA: response regulator [Gemmataceae bacterium]|jgi:response regulator NasT
MSRILSIVVADDESAMRDYFQELLPRLGHRAAVAADGKQLVDLCRASRPDLIITDIRMGDTDGLEAAEAINREVEVPVILVSAHHDSELQARALRDHVMAYLVKPVKEADLRTAIDLAMLRFGHFQALKKEAADLKQALEDRKVVERAKGAVVRRSGVPEAEAFRRLRKYASDRNLKLVEVARQVLAAEEVFHELDDRR